MRYIIKLRQHTMSGNYLKIYIAKYIAHWFHLMLIFAIIYINVLNNNKGFSVIMDKAEKHCPGDLISYVLTHYICILHCVKNVLIDCYYV